MLQDTKTTTLWGNAVVVRFPNVGQYIDIENIKATLTKGKYAIMALNLTPAGKKALDYVDAIAYGSILCRTEFLKKFGEKTLNEYMSMTVVGDMADLVRWYTDEYAPFHNSIEKRDDRHDIKEEAVAEEKSAIVEKAEIAEKGDA